MCCSLEQPSFCACWQCQLPQQSRWAHRHARLFESRTHLLASRQYIIIKWNWLGLTIQIWIQKYFNLIVDLHKVFVVLSFPNIAKDCQFCNYQICVALTWLQAEKRSLKIIFCKSNDQRLLSSFCVFGQMIRSEESSNFGKVHWSRIHHLLFCLSFDQVLALP